MRYPRSYGALSKTKNVKLKWAFTWTAQGWQMGAKQDWVFFTNGLWDPFQGSQNGIQPRYFDQYCTTNGGQGFYANYIVRGCKMHIVIQNLTPVPLNGATCNFGSPVVDIRPSTYDEALSRGDCKTFLLGANDTSNGLVHLKYYVNNASILNARNQKDDPDCWGYAGANPVRQAKSTLRIWNNYGGVVGSATVSVTMTFYVHFFNLNDIPDSTLLDPEVDVDDPYGTDLPLTADGQVTMQPDQELTTDPVDPAPVSMSFPGTGLPVDLVSVSHVPL